MQRTAPDSPLDTRRPSWPLLPFWWLGNGFAWLGGASWRAVAGRHERSSYQLSGFFVLLNGFVAWALISLAAVGLEVVPDFADALPVTFPWGLFVLAFDRAIAAKVVDPDENAWRSRSSYFFRALCAIVIGFVIAELGALAIFREDVERTMNDTISRQVDQSRRLIVGEEGRPSQRQTALLELEGQLTALGDDRTRTQRDFEAARRHAACERDPRGCDDLRAAGKITGVPGEGDKTRLLDTAADAAGSARDLAAGEYDTRAPGLRRQVGELRAEMDDDLREAQGVAEAGDGVPARWRAMYDFTASDPTGFWMHVMLIAFGVLLDLIPLLVKLWRGRTGYDATVVAHRKRREVEVSVAASRHEEDLRRAWNRERIDEELEVDLAGLRAGTRRRIEVERERVRYEVAVEAIREEPDRLVVAPASAELEPAPVRLPEGWTEEDRALVSHVFGGLYKAVEPLGGADPGAFGRMLRGRDEKSGQDVVIKAVRDTDGRDGTRSPLGEMWQREVDAARKLSHFNIGQVIASGLDKGYLWTASPLYQPGSLVRWIESTADQHPSAYTLQHTIDYVKQLVDALTYAHEHDVTHGDIKPTNAVLHGPTLKLVDWGFARVSIRLEQGAATALAGGTPLYTAPEALLGGEFDAELADLYSVGATWYFLLTGKPPYQEADLRGTAREIAWQVQRRQVRCRPLPEFLPDLPKVVVDLVHDLVSVYPRTRIGDGGGDGPAAHLQRAMTGLTTDPDVHAKGGLPVGPAAVGRRKHGARAVRPVTAPGTAVPATGADAVPLTRMTILDVPLTTSAEAPARNGAVPSTLLEDGS
ncbi:DUF4407 domain-containing protein [Saccharothrix xinjiangensis]|uniref:DUF4407 domain-containing protein n=1 Tax=Saccharothrix xinjiangensis TaxID=204798 RepID=A0ABV9Y189_9PSEU